MPNICLVITHNNSPVRCKMINKAAVGYACISVLCEHVGTEKESITFLHLDKDKFKLIDPCKTTLSMAEFQYQLALWKIEHQLNDGILCTEANLGEVGGKSLSSHAITYSEQLIELFNLRCLILFSATPECLEDAKSWANYWQYQYMPRITKNNHARDALCVPIDAVYITDNVPAEIKNYLKPSLFASESKATITTVESKSSLLFFSTDSTDMLTCDFEDNQANSRVP